MCGLQSISYLLSYFSNRGENDEDFEDLVPTEDVDQNTEQESSNPEFIAETPEENVEMNAEVSNLLQVGKCLLDKPDRDKNL